MHAEAAKSADIYSLSCFTLALEGRKLRYDERAQRCAVSGERGAEERRNVIGHRWHRCDRFSQIVANYHLSVPNRFIRVILWAIFHVCSELIDVYCYAEKVPSTKSDPFDGSYPEYITLHVPDASVESYKATVPWSGFGKIVGLSGEEPEQPEVPEVEKCATPVVTYVDGKMSFSCETEGAEFVTNVVAEDAKKYYDAEIEFSATYNIEVYATKANCENSDTVSVALVWVENGEVNEETGVISVPAAPVLVQGTSQIGMALL